ncbi:MAG: hypothetical protein ABL901_01655 [Hyphomicrobiaceae bacterium]
MSATSTESCADDGAPGSDRDHGFVLIAVLWFLALLAVIVLTLSQAVRLDIQAKSNLRARTQAEMVADGVVLALAARLTEQVAGLPGTLVAANGPSIQCLMDGASVRIAVTDVAGLIDLNTAPVELLARIITGVGEPAASAEAIATAIGDFRDIDDDVSAQGAEAREYNSAGRGYGPKNAPFETVEELDQVLGMRPDLLARLRGLVTVHSRSPALDLHVAPPELLRALSGRADGSEAERLRLADSAGMASGARSRTHAISVDVVTQTGGRFSRTATIEATNASGLGFSIREWSALPNTTDDQIEAEATCSAIGL